MGLPLLSLAKHNNNPVGVNQAKAKRVLDKANAPARGKPALARGRNALVVALEGAILMKVLA